MARDPTRLPVSPRASDLLLVPVPRGSHVKDLAIATDEERGQRFLRHKILHGKFINE